MEVLQRQDQTTDGTWLRTRTAFMHLFSPQRNRFSPSVCCNVQRWTLFILTRTWQPAPSWQWAPTCNLLHYWHISTEHIWTQDRKFLDWTACSEDLSLPAGTDCWDTRDLEENRLDFPCAHAGQLDRTATLFGRRILMGTCYKALNKLKGWAKTKKSIFPTTGFYLSHNNIMTTINEINLKIKKFLLHPITLNHQIIICYVHMQIHFSFLLSCGKRFDKNKYTKYYS